MRHGSRFRHTVQGDSGGTVNILGCDIIGNCEKYTSHEHHSYSEWQQRQIFESTELIALGFGFLGWLKTAKFTKERWVHEKSCVLLPA